MITGRPGKKIMCINDGNMFNSITDAADYYKVTRSAISKQLNGMRSQVDGRYFIYVDDTSDVNAIRKQKIEEIYKLENIKIDY